MAHDHGRHCHCQAEHRPAPLELNAHHIVPLAMGGPDVEANIAWVCPTTHANVHELMRHILRGTLTTYTQAAAMYELPVNRYAWLLAALGVERFRAGG